MKEGDINSDWFPYAVTVAIAVATAGGVWLFTLWGG